VWCQADRNPVPRLEDRRHLTSHWTCSFYRRGTGPPLVCFQHQRHHRGRVAVNQTCNLRRRG
jgi:hypothetical protein